MSLGKCFQLMKVSVTGQKSIWLYFIAKCPFTRLSIKFFVSHSHKTVVPPPDVSPYHFFHRSVTLYVGYTYSPASDETT